MNRPLSGVFRNRSKELPWQDNYSNNQPEEDDTEPDRNLKENFFNPASGGEDDASVCSC